MQGQMSIWDFLGDEKTQEGFFDLTDKEIAEVIGERLGVCFVYNNYLEHWEYKIKKKSRIDLSKSKYSLAGEKNGQPFISAGWDYKSTEGGGCPCDSIDEAVNYLRNGIERIERRIREDEERRNESK